MHLVMANEGGGGLVREYRKGNWTVQETMVLIEAKKMDEERRMKRVGESSSSGELGGMLRSKPAELRWKWVEDYCWRNGCLRSQNQCNDKWDNLMRDFKKVRDHERRLSVGDDDQKERLSYWKIEKHERKQRNLPSNMLPQIYEALVDVVERRGGLRLVVAGGGSGGGGPAVTATTTGFVVESRSTTNVIHPSLPPPLLQQHPISPPVAALLTLPPSPQPPLPSPPAAAAQAAQLPPQGLPHSQPLPTVDSDTSEHSDSSPAKRRRKGGGGGGGGGGEGTSGSSNANEVGSAISRSASIIAEAIQACEEREERRHRDLLSMHQRRLQIEESKAEITRQGINGLVDSINKLANSILALSSNKNQPTPK